jgi:uncharacterized protein
LSAFRFFWQRAARIQDRRAIQARKARPARKAPKACTPLDYVGLQKVVADAREALLALKPADVNALEGRDVVFQFREFKMPFVAEGFLLSFSLPNFHFRATTAYDILRSRGVRLGKRDYLGQLRMKN